LESVRLDPRKTLWTVAPKNRHATIGPMDVEKTMEFILSQQAQFSTDIQELKAAQMQSEAKINKLADLMGIVVPGIRTRQ